MNRHKIAMQCAIVVLLAAVVIAAYLPMLANDWCLDDDVVKTGDYPQTLWEIPYLLLQSVPHGNSLMYRPFTFASFTCDRVLWGDWITGYHLTNLLLAVVAAWLAFRVACQVMAWPYALGAALVFAVLPAHSEAVISVFNRSQLLGAIAIWLVLALLPRTLAAGAAPGWLWLSGLLTLLGCWSKESTVVMPLLTLLWVYASGLAADKDRLRQTLSIQVAAGVLYLVTRLLALGSFSVPGLPGVLSDEPLLTRYFTAAFCLTTYFRLTFWPFPLSCDYPLTPVSFHAMGLVYPVLFGALVYLLIKGKTFARLCSMALLWFVVCLLPVLHLAPLSIMLAERFLYPAAWGIVLCAALLLSRLPARQSWRCLTLALVAAAATASLFITASRCHDWRDNHALWQNTVQVFPHSYRAAVFFGSQHAREGNALSLQRRKEDAARHYARAIACYEKVLASPATVANELLAHYNLMLVWHSLGEKRKAEQELRAIFAMRPDYAPAWMFLGNIALHAGDWQRASLCYRKVPGPRNLWDKQYMEAQRRIAYAESQQRK